MSWLRFPLAVICALIVLLHAATLIQWSVTLCQYGATTTHGRLAFIYVPLRALGVGAFAAAAWGLLTKRSDLVVWGLGLFVVEVIVQIAVIAVLSLT
jgi:hypothetical protein